MPFDLYKNTQIGDVTTYIRPFQTISSGPLNGPNSMIISEELVTILPDLSVTTIPLNVSNVPDLRAVITDPNQAFDIVNPVTGDITGSMTFAQLKVQMYSLYLYLASIRDQG